MRRTILLIDDTRTIRAVLRVLLGPRYDYLDAEDGTRALQLAEQHRPDLILLDVAMQGLDGLATLEQLKRTAATQKIPVIMVTAEKDVVTRARCRDLGAAGYVIKPLRWQALQDAVRPWLPE